MARQRFAALFVIAFVFLQIAAALGESDEKAKSKISKGVLAKTIKDFLTAGENIDKERLTLLLAKSQGKDALKKIGAAGKEFLKGAGDAVHDKGQEEKDKLKDAVKKAVEESK